MSFNLNNFKNQPPIVIIKDEDISGLSIFKKRLEQFLFSEVIIRNSDVKREQARLVIEMSCNFSLQQGLSHLKSGIWGQQGKVSPQSFEHSTFYNLVRKLQEKNDFLITVEEFSLLFSDCTIVISSLYTRSIPEQLDVILTQIANHYAKLTHGMRKMPFEIFIPVLNQGVKCNTTAGALVSNLNADGYKASDYYAYWGVYFDDENDALIYDLNEQTIINGVLNMLTD